ncbi:MAG: hypothetical protein IJS15_04145 [Victivallales bacterium]|nr:hypothetical protein [Victivallales bacterium]
MPSINDKPLDSQTAREIADLHFGNLRSGAAIRNLSHRQVSRVEHASGKFIVKSYRINLFRRFFSCFPFSTDYATILQGLTPPLRANFAYSFNCQVTITDDAGPTDMFALFGKAPLPPDFRQTYSEAGKLLAKIHARRIFHADAKTPNFVLNQNLQSLPPVLIIDCDKVRQLPKLPEDKMVFNFAQFMACHSMKCDPNLKLFPEAIAAFLNGYEKESGTPHEVMRRMATQALACALGNRKIELRVSPELLKDVIINYINRR